MLLSLENFLMSILICDFLIKNLGAYYKMASRVLNSMDLSNCHYLQRTK